MSLTSFFTIPDKSMVLATFVRDYEGKLNLEGQFKSKVLYFIPAERVSALSWQACL
jgi:hypothetical protein